jgi:large repetitive protein
VWIKRLALILAFGAVLAVASDAPAGGISDETCPNTRGENTNTCPPGTVGAPYSIRFVEREGTGCGPGRQTFHLDSGVLPPGLTLRPDGTLSGTATRPGSFQFYVEMREPDDDPATCAGKRTQKQFTLRIRQQPWIVSRPTVPPSSEVGVPFRMTLRARGGSGIFFWTVADGKLPDGLKLGTAGAITGAPRRAGTFRFEAKARDTEARSLRWAATISVAPRLRIPAQRLPAARVAQSYGAQLASAGGVGPSVWKVTRGRLPGGIRLVSSSGRLTGTPKEAGAYLVTIEAEDRLGVEHARTFRIVVLERRKPPSTT